MGSIAKFATSALLTLGLAIPASALASEQPHPAPTTSGAHSAGVITLP